MPEKQNSENIFEDLEKLPESLKDIMFSPDTADKIANICEKFNVPPGKFSLVAKAVGMILSKMSPVKELPRILEKEAKIKKNKAENIAQEIDSRIFSQVRGELVATEPQKTPPESIKPRGADAYREPIE